MLRDRLAKEAAGVLDRNGNRFVHSRDHMLISLTRFDNAPAFDLIGETNYHSMPDYMARACILGAQNIRDKMNMVDKWH